MHGRSCCGRLQAEGWHSKLERRYEIEQIRSKRLKSRLHVWERPTGNSEASGSGRHGRQRGRRRVRVHTEVLAQASWLTNLLTVVRVLRRSGTNVRFGRVNSHAGPECSVFDVRSLLIIQTYPLWLCAPLLWLCRAPRAPTTVYLVWPMCRRVRVFVQLLDSLTGYSHLPYVAHRGQR